MELVALVGGYTYPLGPTISEDMQMGSNTLASPKAHFLAPLALPLGYIKPGVKLIDWFSLAEFKEAVTPLFGYK